MGLAETLATLGINIASAAIYDRLKRLAQGSRRITEDQLRTVISEELDRSGERVDVAAVIKIMTEHGLIKSQPTMPAAVRIGGAGKFENNTIQIGKIKGAAEGIVIESGGEFSNNTFTIGEFEN